MKRRINVKLTEDQLLILMDLLEASDAVDLQATIKAVVRKETETVTKAALCDRDVFVHTDRGWC